MNSLKPVFRIICRGILISLLFFNGTAAYSQSESPQVLWKSKPLVANSTKAQNYSASITLEDNGEHNLPLILYIYNGTKTAPGFKWLRINIGNLPLITEAQFVGGKVATIDVSGELGPEYNQMLVSGQGPVGATLSWLIATPRIHISDVHPKEVVQGEQVIITGNNLCSDPSVYKVTFNGVAGTVTNATSSQITVTVPSLPAGSCNIQVADFSQTVAAPPIYIKAVPIITGMSIMAGPPGSAFTIYGKGFSADPNEDKVFVSGVQAEVYSASPTQINTCIPTMDYPRPTSVRVQVGNGPESNAWRLLLYNQLY